MKKFKTYAYELSNFNPATMKGGTSWVNRYRGEYFFSPEDAYNGALAKIAEDESETGTEVIKNENVLAGKKILKEICGEKDFLWVETPVRIIEMYIVEQPETAQI